MQNKQKETPKTCIYRSINKDTIKDSLYSTWVFACWGKVGKEETAVIKDLEILNAKWHLKTDQGDKNERRKTTAHQLVSSF